MTGLSRKGSALGLALMASSATWAGCETGELLDNPSDASFGGNGNGNGGGNNDATNGDGPTGGGNNATTGGNNGSTPDGGSPNLDAAVSADWDYELGAECVETFVYTPEKGATDITEVVLVGGSPLSWGGTLESGALAMQEVDGKWVVRVRMDSATVPYKFVVNPALGDAAKWLPDPDPKRCHDEDDGYGAKNTLRYACQEQPPCGGPDPDGGLGDASVEPDDGGTFNLGSDCVETLTYDQGSRTDVTSVVIAGGAPFVWSATVGGGAIPMTKVGNVWSAKVSLDSTTIPYKLVINGSEWIADPNPDMCHVADDGFGGVNTLLYACQTAPACGGDGGTSPDGGVADAGSSMDAAATDAGVADAAVVDSGSTPAPDFSFGTACVETFEFDPALYPEMTATKVEVRGTAPLSWTTSLVTLSKKTDGIWRATVAVDAADFEYKLVINDNYLLDRANGATSNGTSLRKACGTPVAPCKNVSVVWDPVAGGCGGAVPEAQFIGSLTEWKLPLQLTKGGDGKFRGTFPSLPPGSYEYKIRHDNGATWISPSTTTCGGDANGTLTCP